MSTNDPIAIDETLVPKFDAARVTPSESASQANGAEPAPQKAGDVVTSLTLDTLRELFQSAGYRIETAHNGEREFLRSATNGLPFDIRPGNSLGIGSDRFLDIALVALFTVQGTLPLDLLNRWNQARRFGRLFLDRPTPDHTFLVFCMDITVAGGVTPAQLRNQIALWEGLVQQFLPWLREEIGKIAPTVDAPSSSSAGRAPANAGSPMN